MKARLAACLLALLPVGRPALAEGPPIVLDVRIPADGIDLKARLVPPTGDVAGDEIVALHGCGGPFPARDRQWERILTDAGHFVLWPDSFGSRGLGSQCGVADRTITPGRERLADTRAAVAFLRQSMRGPERGIVVIGWSNGGSTVLAASAEGALPPGAVRRFIAFYPGCRVYAEKPGWAPSAPLLILIGADDDWTPAEPCRQLAARFPDRITLVEYPGAYHDFDVPNRAIQTRTGLAFTANSTGVAHTGTNAPAREDAIARVQAFLAAN